jgi:hypothetical protein
MVSVKQSASVITGRPQIFFADLLAVASVEAQGRPFALANADLILTPISDLAARAARLRPGELILSRRIDIDELGQSDGRPYPCGYDFFACHADDVCNLPDIGMVFGAPWWDHFFPLLMLIRGCRIYQIEPAAWHLKHAERWTGPTWEALGMRLVSEIKPHVVGKTYGLRLEDVVKNTAEGPVRMLDGLTELNLSVLDGASLRSAMRLTDNFDLCFSSRSSNRPTLVPFRIYTTHGTVLYVDDAKGELRHGQETDVPLNLFLIAEESGCVMVHRGGSTTYGVVCFADGQWFIRPWLEEQTPTVFVRCPVTSDTTLVGLRAGPFFLCAEPNGEVSLNRLQCQAWERFSLIAHTELEGNDKSAEECRNRFLSTAHPMVDPFAPIDPSDPSYAKVVADYCCQAVMVGDGQILQVYEELVNLAYWVRGFAPHNVLEIGTVGSTFFLLSRLSTGKKVGVDLRDRRSRLHHFMFGEDWRFFQGDSQTPEMQAQVRAFCDKFDLIFIDGDHGYEGVKKDFENYRPLLSDRGVVLFHDVHPDHAFKGTAAGDVWKFWAELDEGSKTLLCCSRSSGRIEFQGHGVHFGGIGIWFPPRQ